MISNAHPAASGGVEREALLLHADRDPMPGVENPGAHQLYRNPRVSTGRRCLTSLLPDAIRVEMLYAGVCGTDLHLTGRNPSTGYVLASGPLSVPGEGRIIGHEGVGRVLAVGAGVRDIVPGMIVALESMVACGRCDCCARDLPNQCRDARFIGMKEDGFFATVADVPASVAHDVTALARDDQDLQALTCLEPAAVAHVACRNGRMTAGERVVIFGGGPIGIYCAMVARALFGAGEIHLVEPVAFRRELAATWCDHVYTPGEFFASAVERVDVAVEASSFMENPVRVLPRMNAGGRIVLLARSGSPLALPTTDAMITNAVSISGSRGHLGGAFPALIRLYGEGHFHPGAIITRVVQGLDALAELLQEPGRIQREECKVLVKPGG